MFSLPRVPAFVSLVVRICSHDLYDFKPGAVSGLLLRYRRMGIVWSVRKLKPKLMKTTCDAIFIQITIVSELFMIKSCKMITWNYSRTIFSANILFTFILKHFDWTTLFSRLYLSLIPDVFSLERLN